MNLSLVASVETPVFIEDLRTLSGGQYNLVATTTLLLWDIIITLPREKKYIWSYHSKPNWITIFYIITRYMPFITNVACLISMLQLDLFRVSGMLNFSDSVTPGIARRVNIFTILYLVVWLILLISAEILFIRRVVALHGGSRLLSRILAGFLICELTSTLIFYLQTIPVTLFPVAIYVTTSNSRAPNALVMILSSGAAFSYPELVFQALLVMLVIKVVISDWRGISERGFLSIVVRDGIYSYVFNLCGLLVITFPPAHLSGPFGLPNILWSFVSFSITSTRLVLNLRAAAKQSGANNSSLSAGRSGVGTHLTFLQGIQSFLTSGAPENDEFATSYHCRDFGHDSDSEND